LPPAMPGWPEMVEYCREAEAIGSDATSDLWDAPTILAGIAAATKKVAIGLLIACTAFRNRALLADRTDDSRDEWGSDATWAEGRVARP